MTVYKQAVIGVAVGVIFYLMWRLIEKVSEAVNELRALRLLVERTFHGDDHGNFPMYSYKRLNDILGELQELRRNSRAG